MSEDGDRTEQERFWAGEFGDQYIGRNDDARILSGNLQLFSMALRAAKIESVLELGANIGLNLIALSLLYPDLALSAIEINSNAAHQLSKRLPQTKLHQSSIIEAPIETQHDLVLSKGVLIHINPDTLPMVYDRMARWSRRYVMLAEYYNPSPVEIDYRGHTGKLFKRDFAGEFMDSHPDFHLKDYGFVYRRDPVRPLDDITWFLMERSER